MRKTACKIISLIMVVSVVFTTMSCTSDKQIGDVHLPELEYTEFPTTPYDSSKVHPVRKTGTVTGAEAVLELNTIEYDYIRHYIGDNYVAASWMFSNREAAGISIDKPTLGKVGPGDIKSECEYLSGLLGRLYKIDYENLEKQDRDFYEQIVFDLEEERYIKQYEGFAYMLPAVSLTSLSSFYLTIGFVEIRNKREADFYIELLKDTGRFYDEVCAFEEARSAKGYASIKEFYTSSSTAYYMLAQERQTEPFRELFIEKINAAEGLTDEERTAYIDEFDKVMEEVVIPEFMKSCKRIADLAGTNVNDKGLAGFEHGKEFYEHLLRRQIGKDCDVGKLAKELDKVLKMSPETPGQTQFKGKTNQELLDEMTVMSREYFPDLDISYEIKELPSLFKVVGVGGAYAGRFYDDTSHEIILLPNYVASREVVFHEGIPGHMYQYNYHKTHLKHVYMLCFEQDAYAEGWATYIMNNPARMYGTADDDRFIYTGEVYANKMMQARADICINYEGMTGREAADYVSRLTNEGASFATNALIMSPGLGISYGLGCYMTLKTLESIKTLDPNMDLKTMHTLYLDAGPGCFDRILSSVKREYER